jgi:YidC/Oxa1 family membrane protein insertase
MRVETPHYRAEISSIGGQVKSWEIDLRGVKPMALPGVLGSGGLQISRGGSAPAPVAFEIDREHVKLSTEAPTGHITLRGEDGFGLRVTQVLRFQASTYAVEREIRVENTSTSPQSAELMFDWTSPIEWAREDEKFAGPRPIHIVRLDPGSAWARREYLSSVARHEAPGRWIAFESALHTPGYTTGTNGVYVTALVPQSPGFKLFETAIGAEAGKAARAAQIGWRVTLPTLGPGQAWEGKALGYVGPMEYGILKSYGVGLEKAIYFGGFPFPESWAVRYGMPTLPMEWIVVPVLALMSWTYSFVPNYGFAIVFLTVITKVLFFPLTLKSMSSMKSMQALQPQVNALRAKHKSDPQKAQREMMELYREHGVNPLGGCLPMVVQIPIFYALYDALSVSVALQGAPFIRLGTMPSWAPFLGGECLWICDLAKADPTYVLPILMGASMFVQQKMTPTMGDPRQAKMMLMMPIVFTFMFLSLQSGLVLYWTLSNVLQIAQQKYMERRGPGPKKAPARAPRKA